MLDRAQISARLKAARWLAGTADAEGRPRPLSVADLIDRAPLKSNRIRKNRIEGIEQAKVDARSMELEKIAEALELPYEWFTAADISSLLGGSALVDAEGRKAIEDLERRAPGRTGGADEGLGT